MKRFTACLLPVIYCLLLFTVGHAQDSTSTTNVSTMRWRGRTSVPSLSTTGNAVCYFDKSLGKLQCSQNGGAFADLGGGGGSGSPGGSNTQVQFNDSGSFGGDAGLVYNKTTNVLTITSGGLTLTSSTINKVTITPPATGSTLTIADGATLTASATATVSGTNTGDQTSVTGNAGTATALQTARAINGVNFDGTAAITVTAAAGTLSGATLASGVTASSLTSFGSSPTLVTPTIGVATATSINKWAFTAPSTAATLTAGGDSLTYTMPASSQTIVGRSSTDTLTNKTYDTAGSGNAFSIGGQSITSVSGNTAKVVTTTGTLTSGDCVKIDASGNFIANGSACGGSGGLTIGTTTIASGTDTRVLFNNAGVLGQYVITGTGNVAMSASPTFTGTVALAAATASGTIVQTSANAAAFESGPNGSTNPILRLVNNVASAATGLSITGNAAGSGVTLTALSSATDESIKLVPKGAGQLLIPPGTSTAPGIAWSDRSFTGFFHTASGSNSISWVVGTHAVQGMLTTGVTLVNTGLFGWSTDSADPTSGFNPAIESNAAGIVGINNGTAGQWGALKVGTHDAGTTTITNGLIVGHQSTGTAAAGLGSAVLFNLDSSTTADQNAARIVSLWTTATHASRTSDLVFYTVNNAAALAEAGRFTGAGNLTITGTATLTGITSDATHTDATLCEDTTTHTIFSGSGTLGICLGTSSARFKNTLNPLDEGLREILALRPVSFFYNPNHGDGGRRLQYGFTAEDVRKVFPVLVGLDEAGKPNSVDMLGMFPAVVRSIQEMQTEIEMLRTEIQNLKKSKH